MICKGSLTYYAHDQTGFTGSYFLASVSKGILKLSICYVQGRAERGRGGGNWGILPWSPLRLFMGPKRSIYSNRTVKHSIKAVTTYILPWSPRALSAALASYKGYKLTNT